MFGFSIIVPVYKVEESLPKCMDSLLGQHYDPSLIEIILVDDGSPDNCGQMCDDYAARYSHVRSVHKENGGLSDARNFGLLHATKDYVLFVDSDDYIEPDTCRWFNEVLEKHDAPIDMCMGGLLKHIGSRTRELNTFDMPLAPVPGKEHLKNRLLHRKIIVAAWASAYRRQFLEENRLRFCKGRVHEDEEFTPRAMLKARQVVACPHVFYHYVVRDDSITTAKDKSKNALDIFANVESLHGIYRALDDKRLANLLMTHSAQICFRAVEMCGLYRKNQRVLIDKATIRKNCVRMKEKLEYAMLCLYPPLLHFSHVIRGMVFR